MRSCMNRSYVRFGHTSRRRFVEDAQQFFYNFPLLQELGVLGLQPPDLRFEFFYATLRLRLARRRVGLAFGPRPAVEQRSSDTQLGRYFGRAATTVTP